MGGPCRPGFRESPGETAKSGLRCAGWAVSEASPPPLSSKYLGSRTSEKVKNKILELLYSWTVGLPEEAKITEAYQMLKKQGEAPVCGVASASSLS